MRIPMAVLAGAVLLAPGVALAQSTASPAMQQNPNVAQNWATEQNAATPNGRIYPGDIYGPAPVIVRQESAAPSAAAPARMPQYSTGAQGAELRDPRVVSAVQEALNRRGYSVPVSGVPSTDTRNALVSYQANTGIHPSGEIDMATLSALNIQNSVAATEGAASPGAGGAMTRGQGMRPMMSPNTGGNMPR